MFRAFLICITFMNGAAQAANQVEFLKSLNKVGDTIRTERAASNPMQISFEFRKVPQVRSEFHTEVVPTITDGGLTLTLNYDAKAIETPALLVKDLTLLKVLTKRFLHYTVPEEQMNKFSPIVANSPLWVEMKAASTSGSPLSSARLQMLEIAVLNSADGKYMADALAKNFDSKLNPAEMITSANAKLQAQLAITELAARADEANRKRAYLDWASQDQQRNQAESMDAKLNDLVLQNDREGVAKLLELYLPWTLMEAGESLAWRTWLEAIERPNYDKAVIAFRGVDFKTDKVQKLKTQDGRERFGFLSTVLTKNQGNYTRRLRSLVTNRLKNGDTHQVVDGRFVGTISDQMGKHALKPVASNFLSFTSSLKAAAMFIGKPVARADANKKIFFQANGGLLAVRMDPRRLAPNLMSPFPLETEFLAPLIIFPDEVFFYQEMAGDSDGRLEADVEKYQKVLESKLKMSTQVFQKASDATYTVDGYKMYERLLLSKATATGVRCEVLF